MRTSLVERFGARWLWSASSIAAVLVSSPTRAAVPPVPPIEVSVDRSEIELGEVEVGTVATDAFGVTNDSQCPVTLELRGSGSGAISTLCSGLTSGGEIGAGSHVGCGVVFSPRTKKTHTRGVLLVFGYGHACRRDLHEIMDVELEPQRRKRVDERDQLQSNGPDTTVADEQLAAVTTRTTGELATLEAKNLELDHDSPEIVEAVTKHRQLQTKVFERVGKLQRRWNELQAAGPSTEAVEKLQAVRSAKLELDKARLQKARAEQEAEVSRLTGERDQALEELRNGRFCAKCGQSESEYHRLGRHLHEESFEDHIATRGVRGATPEELVAKEQEYASLILRVEQQIRALDDDLTTLVASYERAATELAAKTQLLQKRHRERLEAIDAKLAEVRRTMAEQIATVARRIVELRDTADRARALNERKIEQLRRDLVTARATHTQAVADIEQEHEDTLARLDREIDELDDQHRVDERTLDRKLRATASAKVTVRGRGVAR